MPLLKLKSVFIELMHGVAVRISPGFHPFHGFHRGAIGSDDFQFMFDPIGIGNISNGVCKMFCPRKNKWARKERQARKAKLRSGDILGYSILVICFFRRTAVRLYDAAMQIGGGFMLTKTHPQFR
jgi:hypothetical protein